MKKDGVEELRSKDRSQQQQNVINDEEPLEGSVSRFSGTQPA